MRAIVTIAFLLTLSLGANGRQGGDVDYGVMGRLDILSHSLSSLPAQQYSDSMGTICATLALGYKDKAQYDSAEAVYRYALADTIMTPSVRNALLLNMCELYLRRGMYQTACDTLESIGAPYRKNRWYRRRAETLVYLSIADTTTRCYREAMDIYGRCLANDIKMPKGEMWEIYANRGYLYAQYGKLDSALTDMRHAVALLEGRDTTTRYHRWVVTANMAVVEARTGDHDAAIVHIDNCLDWFSDHKRDDDYVIALRKKAEILLMRGDKKGAAAILRQYVEAERSSAIKLFATFGEQERLDYWNNKKQLISEAFALEDECPALLFDVSIFRRETALIGYANAEEKDWRLRMRGDDVRRSLKRGEAVVDFIRYDKDSVRWYGAIVATSLAGKGGVWFVPLWSERQFHDFDLGGMTLKEAACSADTSPKDAIYDSEALSRMVWEPLSPYIAGARDVYFCPEGLLNMIAVEYLPYDGVSDVTFHRLTSFAPLTRRGGRHASGGRMLAVGGLDYNQRGERGDSLTTPANHDAADYLHRHIGVGGSQFANLAGTKAEIMAIRKSMPDADTAVVMMEEQWKEVLRDSLYTMIHLSTHGYSLVVDVAEKPVVWVDSLTEDRSLLATGIALSGANVAYMNPHLEDGLWSAREICETDLRGVDLIVVSACQTGVGEVSDEGPAGLLRALKKAGAKTVVVSLWQVDDNATQLLMASFYDLLAHHNGISATEALDEARRRTAARQETVVRKKRRFNAATLASEIVDSQTMTTTPFSAPCCRNGFIVIDDI